MFLSNKKQSLSKKQTGDLYEHHARLYLTRHGLMHIDSNVRFKQGELDLIMSDGSCIVFVEVKFRKQSSFGGAAAAISPQKRKRLLNAAYLWLIKKRLSATSTEFRFDAVTFDGDANAVNWVKNILIEG